jgi:hypothetical protein
MTLAPECRFKRCSKPGTVRDDRKRNRWYCPKHYAEAMANRERSKAANRAAVERATKSQQRRKAARARRTATAGFDSFGWAARGVSGAAGNMYAPVRYRGLSSGRLRT